MVLGTIVVLPSSGVSTGPRPGQQQISLNFILFFYQVDIILIKKLYRSK
jgi:hypothetical protein